MYRVTVLPNGVDGAVRITVNGSVWDDSALAFVNRASRSLTVRKTVEGEMGDRSKTFPFTAVLTVDGQAVPFPVGEGYTVSGGQAVFALRHGESLTFTGLPYGGVVTVTETEHAGYTVTNSGRSGDSGAVTLGDGGELVFVNTKRAVPIWRSRRHPAAGRSAGMLRRRAAAVESEAPRLTLFCAAPHVRF